MAFVDIVKKFWWAFALGGVALLLIIILPAALVPRPVPCDDLPISITAGVGSEYSVCVSPSTNNLLTIKGQNFLNIEGTPATVNFMGTPLKTYELKDCSDVGVYRRSVDKCSTATLTIPAGGYTLSGSAYGLVDVNIKNGDPCNKDASTQVLAVESSTVIPSVSSVCPQSNSFSLIGENFLIIDGVEPTYTVNGLPVTSVAGSYGNCTEVILGTHSVKSCNRVFVNVPTFTGTAELSITNPVCSDASTKINITAAGGSQSVIVFFVDPGVVYNQINVQVTIFTSGLNATSAKVSIIHSTSGAEHVLTQLPTTNPNKIKANIPPGYAPGTYDVFVDGGVLCSGYLIGGLTIVSAANISLESADPSYVYQQVDTPVTIKSTPTSPPFLPGARAYLTPSAGAGAQAVGLTAVNVVDGNTITAVVQKQLTAGAYDLIIVNPDSQVGVLSSGITVTVNPPPVVYYVSPGTVLSSVSSNLVDIYGDYFDVANVSVTAMCSTDNFVNSLFTVNVPVQSGWTSQHIVGSFDGGAIGSGTLCLVLVTNGDGASFKFPSISCFSNSANLAFVVTPATLVSGRVYPAVVAGRPTQASRILYVLGGEYLNGTAMDSSEVAPVSVTGALGNMATQSYVFPEPRSRGRAVTVGGFVYYVGGVDATGTAQTSVLRAQILDPLATPLPDLDINLRKELTTFPAGLYFYRISAVFGASDPSNPSGESLTGEPLTVKLPGIQGLVLTVSWDAIPDAVGYNVYRTPVAGMTVGQVQLIAYMDGNANTSFVDDYSMTPSTQVPLVSGSLGQWKLVENMNVARSLFALAAIKHPSQANTYKLLAVGGMNPTFLSSSETATITITNPVVYKGRQTQTISTFTANANYLSVQAQFTAYAGTTIDYAGILNNQTVVYFSAGQSAVGTAQKSIGYTVLDDTNIDTNTYSFAFTTGQQSNDMTNPCMSMYPSHLMMVGGSSNAASADKVISAAQSSATSVSNWNAGFSLNNARQNHGCVKESGHVFVAGGSISGAYVNSVEYAFL